TKLLVVLFAMIAAITTLAGLCACKSSCGNSYTVTVDTEKSTVIYVGDEIDYTQYFTVKDKNGNQIIVTNDMLDLSEVDTSAPCSFTVTLKIGKTKESLTFFVIEGTKIPDVTDEYYTITVNTSKSTTLTVGDAVDFKEYFTVTDQDGNNVPVTDLMLDTSKVDTTKAGSFTVTLTVGDASKSLTFTVKAKDSGTITPPTDELKTVFAKYTDLTSWNFAVNYQEVESGTVVYEDYYEYLGKNILYKYDRYDDNETYLGIATDYLGYDEAEQAYYLYYDNLNNSYTRYKDGSTDFYNYYLLYDIDLTSLGTYTFNKATTGYDAASPNDVGNTVIGEFTGYTWTKFNIQISNGNISQIDATMSDGYVFRFVFNNYGQVNFTLPEVVSVSVNSSKSTVIHVDDEVDYTQYFIITDASGSVTVTNAMLDLSKVDVSKEGTFTVTATYKEISATATFTVVAKGTDITTTPATLAEVLAKYTDSTKWNFAVNALEVDDSGEYEDYEEYCEYLGNNVLRTYLDDNNKECTGYMEYDAAGDVYYCYLANSDGTFTKYDQTSDEFSEFYGYSYIIDISSIASYTFLQATDYYMATNPSEVGNAILGEYDGYSWTSFNIYVENGNISKIVTVLDGGSNGSYTRTYTFSKHGSVNFTLPDATGSTTPTIPTGTMEKQVYNPDTFDNERLQAKQGAEGADGAIGLPSIGTYNALVIPVQFKNESTSNQITQAKLNKLNLAFNGTETDTGWESVKTYYQKASYGALNLTFDIQPVYNASNDASYYETYKEEYVENGETYTRTGDELVLTEALAYYESRLDLTKYDTNGDGCIDAVYLIYSHSVDYDNADFYWAYVTWYYGENQYDGLDAFYYMFTGFDFMDEDLDKFDGMIINAETYIHETGHLLGLDDYYDYDSSRGSNEGLGGADMMDYNKGDHGVYSKIMLNWLTPTIVTTTQTITISSSQAVGDAILVPLKFNNSYFCEYLLIDLYSAEGLNKLASEMDNSILYGGASYGVRIYHVSSWIDNPYSDTNYGSFTNYNNSTSSISLIKLIEADGYTKFSDTSGEASQTDLWQAGQSLSEVFPQYMTNDAKLLNFDISIDSVSADSATITITYKA
ncbi:MAG: bacterial Ig-like domain-containing protein, partial [Clostridia bacterium]|nr:bacterial Ig-like domain-containing protein [Clostridia bacterium]